jgi:hypothetical protein
MAELFQRALPSSHARLSAVSPRRGVGFPSVPFRACALAVLLLLLPDSARTQTGGCSEQSRPETAGTDSPEQPGLKAFIDPDTGELISEPVDMQPAEAPAQAAAQPELPVEERPDGTLVLDLTENPVNELRVEKVAGKLVECHRENEER